MSTARSTYDYIIAGGGLSGLSLAWHLVHSPLSGKRILVADRRLNAGNDKTWCFWHTGEPPFPEVIHRRWGHTQVFSRGEILDEQLKEYSYSCIRSGDFYNYMLGLLSDHPSVDLLETPIDELEGNPLQASMHTPEGSYEADFIFQSCFRPQALRDARPSYPLIQHFMGMEIETDKELFNPDRFILMDFDETYREGVAFIYLLPWDQKSALVEYTIFSDRVEQPQLYEEKIELYLYNRFRQKRLGYSVKRTEYGEIPMQDLPYVPWYAPRILNLGTYGGLTKPTTGYTFSRIQKHSKNIIESLINEGKPAPAPRSKARYRAYDLWLLHIMHRHPAKAKEVFHQLFMRNSIDRIFRFLGEESTLAEDLKIMASVPYTPFLKAIWATKKRLLEL